MGEINIVYYNPKSGKNIEEFFYDLRFHDDLKTGLSLIVSEQTRKLIGTQEALHKSNVKVIRAASQDRTPQLDQRVLMQGFEELSWSLGEISYQLEELGVMFRWGFNKVLAETGKMNKSLEEILKVLKTPIQRDAYNQFDIARDNFRKGLYSEAIDRLDLVINGSDSSHAFPESWESHFLKGLIELGNKEMLDMDLVNLINPQEAEKSFLDATKYSIFDHPQEAAKSYLCASKAAEMQECLEDALVHVQNSLLVSSVRDPRERLRIVRKTSTENVEETITILGSKGVRFNESNTESVYQLSRILTQLGSEEGLNLLPNLIQREPLYSLKAANDSTFQQHNEKLDQILNDELERLNKKAVYEVKTIFFEAKNRLERSGFENFEEYLANSVKDLTDPFKNYGILDYIKFLKEKPYLKIKETLNKEIKQIEEIKTSTELKLTRILEKAKEWSLLKDCQFVQEIESRFKERDKDWRYLTSASEEIPNLRDDSGRLTTLEGRTYSLNERLTSSVKQQIARFKYSKRPPWQDGKHRIQDKMDYLDKILKWTGFVNFGQFKNLRDEKDLEDIFDHIEGITKRTDFKIHLESGFGPSHPKVSYFRKVWGLMAQEDKIWPHKLARNKIGTIKNKEGAYVSETEFKVVNAHTRMEGIKRIIINPFEAQINLVTPEQWLAVTGDLPEKIVETFDGRAVKVSISEAKDFCNSLSRLYGFKPVYFSMFDNDYEFRLPEECEGFRLPTIQEVLYLNNPNSELSKPLVKTSLTLKEILEPLNIFAGQTIRLAHKERHLLQPSYFSALRSRLNNDGFAPYSESFSDSDSVQLSEYHKNQYSLPFRPVRSIVNNR